jgi:hypothetical protein
MTLSLTDERPTPGRGPTWKTFSPALRLPPERTQVTHIWSQEYGCCSCATTFFYNLEEFRDGRFGSLVLSKSFIKLPELFLFLSFHFVLFATDNNYIQFLVFRRATLPYSFRCSLSFHFLQSDGFV